MLVTLAVLLPTLLTIIGLIFDGGMMTTQQMDQQHVTDAAALAAAVDIRTNESQRVNATAASSFGRLPRMDGVVVETFCPPRSGRYAGDSRYVEVLGETRYQTSMMSMFSGYRASSLRSRAVAGVAPSGPGAALVVLDPLPAPLSIADWTSLLQNTTHPEFLDAAGETLDLLGVLEHLPLLSAVLDGLLQQQLTDCLLQTVTETWDLLVTRCVPIALPALTAGLEIEGLGSLTVEGAVHVNNRWGGVDECGERAGIGPALPAAVACMPLVPTTRLITPQIRVVGGVDDPRNYRPLDPAADPPLRANQLPVPDPLADLSAPTTSGVRAGDVVAVAVDTKAAELLLDRLSGALSVLLRPVFDTVRPLLHRRLTQVTLHPGVYDSLTVLAPGGGAVLQPGVYVIRGKNPATGLSLCLLGPVHAEGVLFCIQDPGHGRAGHDGLLGPEPAGSASTEPPPRPHAVDLLPSVVIAPLLPGGRLTGLQDPDSPYRDMLIYQQRSDRRPILLEGQHLVGGGDLSGTVYAPWGHVSLVSGAARHDLRIVSGTARVLTVGDTTLAPQSLFRPAEDVVLVE
ncbi:pilus assembly protein TadG-related protein [Roseimaritima sediminicola]|uniref:pilus assembly protein TadG-related protein n=1 Tax=Roseimaritima sediminicola TaxID=2662066 RepID=UPI001F2659CD|nr:pilus assembly protein TadG-related protein [Roseimaritima sediminicola]